MSLLKWINLVQSTPAPPKTAPPTTPPPPAEPENPLTTARWNHKRFGMENFGNTCYANSVLQALYFCDPFRQLVCDAPDRSYPTTPEALAAAQAAVAQLPPAPRAKPAHARRPSAADPRDFTTPHHASFGAGPSALAASAFIHAPGGPPPKTTSAPTPAPIVNVGPVIPALPPSLFSALRSLFIHIAANPVDKGTVSPRAFVEKLKKENELFRSNMHQDAHEFLNYLLNSVVEDLTQELKAGPEELSKSIASTSSGSRDTSPHLTLVHDLFEGTLTSETRCLTCETVSSRDESFLDLSIDIERNSSVTACLRQFSASEMLCQKNKFFCDSCCGLQEAEKRMKIKKLPNVLALHLKRFKYQEDVQRYIKLSYRVAFPFELRLFNTVDDAQDPDRLYELFAIVVHVGSGPHHGHYITIAKQRGQWLLFDDDLVEVIRETEIPKYFGDSPAGSGYVLFYQAVNVDLAALGVQTQPTADASVGQTQPTSAQPQTARTPIIPPVIVEAPTSPTPDADAHMTKVSPDVSESGTIGTPSPSTPTLSSSSPVMSRPEGLPSTTSSASAFGRKASTKLSVGSSGSVLGPESAVEVEPLSESARIGESIGSLRAGEGVKSGELGAKNGEAGVKNGEVKSGEGVTKAGRSRGLSGAWFGWAGKKKDKDKAKRLTVDDASLPVIDIRRPSAPALMQSASPVGVENGAVVVNGSAVVVNGVVPVVNGTTVVANGASVVENGSSPVLRSEDGTAVLHDEPEAGLGMDLGHTSTSVSANSSGDHLLHSSVPALPGPPRVSRSGSVSAATTTTTNGSLHAPSPSRPSPSSSASSVSTPLRHNASAPKLAPFPLTMSPVKEKRPSTASSIDQRQAPSRLVPPVPRLSPPPTRAHTVGSDSLSPITPTSKTKTPKRKLSFSSALNLGSFGRSLGKAGHDRRISIAEDAEAPLVVPPSPGFGGKRK